jgi:hypothetical protein
MTPGTLIGIVRNPHFAGVQRFGESQVRLLLGRTTRHQPIFLGNELAQMCRKLHRIQILDLNRPTISMI